MPWDLAFSVSSADALGYVVAFGEIEGGVFLWNERRWKERS